MEVLPAVMVIPLSNRMVFFQALQLHPELANLRRRGVRKTAVIGATRLGKTHLAAFDFRQSRMPNVLFLVHRENILVESLIVLPADRAAAPPSASTAPPEPVSSTLDALASEPSACAAEPPPEPSRMETPPPPPVRTAAPAAPPNRRAMDDSRNMPPVPPLGVAHSSGCSDGRLPRVAR